MHNNNPNPKSHPSEIPHRPKQRGANIPTWQGGRRTRDCNWEGLAAAGGKGLGQGAIEIAGKAAARCGVHFRIELESLLIGGGLVGEGKDLFWSFAALALIDAGRHPPTSPWCEVARGIRAAPTSGRTLSFIRPFLGHVPLICRVAFRVLAGDLRNMCQKAARFRMEYLFVAGVVQALFTTVFLASKPKRALSDLVLAAWMIFIALPMIDILAMRLWPDMHVPILQSNLIYPLTYGPFMWLYVRAVTGAISRVSQQDLLHFLPFALVSLVQIVTGLAPPLPNPDHMVFDTSTRLVGAVNLVVILSYSWAVAQRLWQHGLKVNQHFSNLPNRVTLKWLFWLIAGFSIVSLLLFLGSLLSLPAVLHVHLPAKIAILFGLSFYGLRQNQVFDLNSPYYCRRFLP